MQDTFEMWDRLPPELKLETVQNLSNRDLVNLAQTSKYHFALFQPLLDDRKLAAFLQCVVQGKHDKVKLLLKDDISLILKKGKVTDYSGREFKNVSGFEYALWALDKHMWVNILACIPSNENGRKVFTSLVAQYEKVKTDGITYKLNGKIITEKHFDFKNTLIKELQTQVDLINAPGDKDEDVIDKQWREGVGGAQKLLPIHIVYEYCSYAQFYPPKFISQPKSSQQFINRITKKYEDWFDVNSKLGFEFAIYKGIQNYIQVLRDSNDGRRWGLCYDLDAMTELCRIRTKDLLELKSKFEEQMSPDNRYRVFQTTHC
ncbi:F-box protein [Legionella cincinnatiensis]|uniref:SidC homolog n=1 Tax=Legionella cincinnatiensis TaxID=28085 RepID=A0A378IFD7_9GAMM|nr:F-box protein [Legionella cincinnatiensis]KTC92241.1 hypothetical protein Lcin_1020 [Legionella cincinnatiensis]STX33455.1 SidC homolog [Legionella cincinnatiensis]